MENILNISNIDNSKYFFSDCIDNNNISSLRMGYYFDNKKDPENLFIKLNCKFISYSGNKIKVSVEDEETIYYFRNLEKISLDYLKSTNLIDAKKCKKYTAFIKFDKKTSLTVLTLDCENNAKFFTRERNQLNPSDIDEMTEIKIVVELDSVIINTTDEKNIYCTTILKMKGLMTLKHIPKIIEVDIPECPFSDDDSDQHIQIEDRLDLLSDNSSSDDD